MKVKMKLFFKWGILFDEANPYVVKEQASRKVEYSCRDDIMEAIRKRYSKEDLDEPYEPDGKGKSGGQKLDPQFPQVPVELHTSPAPDRLAGYMNMAEGRKNG